MNLQIIEEERRDWARIFVTPGMHGSGYDVVLRVDGAYTYKTDADALAEFWSGQLQIPLHRPRRAGRRQRRPVAKAS